MPVFTPKQKVFLFSLTQTHHQPWVPGWSSRHRFKGAQSRCKKSHYIWRVCYSFHVKIGTWSADALMAAGFWKRNDSGVSARQDKYHRVAVKRAGRADLKASIQMSQTMTILHHTFRTGVKIKTRILTPRSVWPFLSLEFIDLKVIYYYYLVFPLMQLCHPVHRLC